jgi:hypothetical protein
MTKTLSDFRGWSHFSEPIKLPNGKKIGTLRRNCRLAKMVLESQHSLREVQAGAHCVTEAAENKGPVEFARIGMFLCVGEAGQDRSDTSRAIRSWRAAFRSFVTPIT